MLTITRKITVWLGIGILFFWVQVVAAEKPFVLFTQPKTGTHLLKLFLEDLTGTKGCWSGDTAIGPHRYATKFEFFRKLKTGQYLATHWFCLPTNKEVFELVLYDLMSENRFLFAHAPYTKEMEEILYSKGYVVFYLLRDPRDYVVSMAFHCLKGDGVIRDEVVKELDFNDLLLLIIEGTDWHNSARYVVQSFIGWKDSAIACPIDFAKLLGDKGGAYSKTAQIQELRKIARALDIETTDTELLESFKRVYGKGPTFRNAKVHVWKEYFHKDHIKVCKRSLGDLIIQMGYEDSLNW